MADAPDDPRPASGVFAHLPADHERPLRRVLLRVLSIVVGCLVPWLCVGFVAAALFQWVVVPKMYEGSRRATCQERLASLGRHFLTDSAPRHDGAALWLGYRKSGRPIERGNERLLTCPGDALVRVPEYEDDKKVWDAVDLDRAPRSLCSFAGRDFTRFPLDPAKHGKEPLGACLSHGGGALVLFSDGGAEWLTLDQLGLPSDDDKVVGPDSKSPVLRVLRFGDGSVR